VILFIRDGNVRVVSSAMEEPLNRGMEERGFADRFMGSGWKNGMNRLDGIMSSRASDRQEEERGRTNAIRTPWCDPMVVSL